MESSGPFINHFCYSCFHLPFEGAATFWGTRGTRRRFFPIPVLPGMVRTTAVCSTSAPFADRRYSRSYDPGKTSKGTHNVQNSKYSYIIISVGPGRPNPTQPNPTQHLSIPRCLYLSKVCLLCRFHISSRLFSALSTFSWSPA